MAALDVLNLAELLPATFTAPGLTEAKFLALQDKFPDCMLEYTADGTVIVMPPTDPKTGLRVNDLTAWSRQQGRGLVTGSDTGFYLRGGSRRAPDAAWFDSARWEASQTPGTLFPTFAPDFVIEIRSPAQRARTLREKMEEYIANGVQLGWLIDPIDRTVTIYRAGHAPEVLSNRRQ